MSSVVAEWGDYSVCVSGALGPRSVLYIVYDSVTNVSFTENDGVCVSGIERPMCFGDMESALSFARELTTRAEQASARRLGHNTLLGWR